MTSLDDIWERALEGGGSEDYAGDVALASLVRAHFLIEGQGVRTAYELLGEEGWRDLLVACETFQLSELGTWLRRATVAESGVDQAYARLVPDHETLRRAFLAHWARAPEAYGPTGGCARLTRVNTADLGINGTGWLRRKTWIASTPLHGSKPNASVFVPASAGGPVRA